MSALIKEAVERGDALYTQDVGLVLFDETWHALVSPPEFFGEDNLVVSLLNAAVLPRDGGFDIQEEGSTHSLFVRAVPSQNLSLEETKELLDSLTKQGGFLLFENFNRVDYLPFGATLYYQEADYRRQWKLEDSCWKGFCRQEETLFLLDEADCKRGYPVLGHSTSFLLVVPWKGEAL